MMSPHDLYEYYGKGVPKLMPEAERELYFIRHGGKWKLKNGKTAGNGLLFHFKEAIRFIWPEIKQHRWFDLFVEEWLSHDYVGVLGPRNSGKSCNAAVCHLVDYYAFPTSTTTLICSTTKERLEDRIWGEIKMLHRRAQSRHPSLPGHLIEGRQRLITDDRDEATEGRDFRNGLIGIPVLKGNSSVGVGSFQGIKNKRVRLCGDELACFVAGTLVDTASGPRPIESIKPGDEVLCAAGLRAVSQTFSRISKSIVRVVAKDGRSIVCTASHRFFTSDGWKKAIDLNQNTYLLSSYEAMRCLRGENLRLGPQHLLPGMCPPSQEMQGVPQILQAQSPNIEADLLRTVLQHEMDALDPRNPRATEQPHILEPKEFSCRPSRDCARDVSMVEGHAKINADQDWAQGLPNTQGHWPLPKDSGGKWNRSNEGREGSHRNVSPGSVELRRQDGEMEWKRVSADLQVGLGFPRIEIGNRSRWGMSRTLGQPPSKGPEKGGIFEGAWVDCVEVLKSGDSHQSPASAIVYNLSVTGHPSFSVSGFLVHNSLPKSFIDAIATLDVQGEFKVTGMGNPAQTTDALGVMCEPHVTLGGWEGGIDQSPKTKTWKTRFENGICIQFPGSDSPNMDVPIGVPPPFPFLMTREVMDRDMETWGKDDWHYTMFNEGRMPRGQGSRRVITRQLCLKHQAMEEPVWLNSNIIYITAMDAAYRSVGGDRCVLMRLGFGPESKAFEAAEVVDSFVNRDSNGDRHKIILAVLDSMIIPIASSELESPEDQIVMFVKQRHEQWGIGPESLYYDAGMRTSLVTAFARLWSPKVNSLDFGNKPSDRPVSREIDVSCRDYYANFVTELWYSVRLAIEAGQMRGLSEEMVQEGCSREWTNVGANKIKVETKEDMKVKSGRSPDFFDCLAAGVEGARQKGFVISRLGDAGNEEKDHRWKRDLMRKAAAANAEHELHYSV